MVLSASALPFESLLNSITILPMVKIMYEYSTTAYRTSAWYRETHSLFGMVLFKECWVNTFNFFIHRFGRVAIADYLIRNMDPKWTDRDGSTLLHLACW